jgi:hypothetical protein
MEILNGIVFNPQPTARKRTSKPRPHRQAQTPTPDIGVQARLGQNHL